MNIKNYVYSHQLHSEFKFRLKEEDLEEIYQKVNMLWSIISKFIIHIKKKYKLLT